MKLQYTNLEKAIYQKQSINDLTQGSFDLIGDYIVADYVGSHTMDPERDKNDLSKTEARVFFEDSGAYKAGFNFTSKGKDFDLAIFATFIVIEIKPRTPQVEFLVLIPQRNINIEETKYAGFMKSQNTDALIKKLNDDSEQLNQISDAIILLLDALRHVESKEDSGVSKGWFSRLMNR